MQRRDEGRDEGRDLGEITGGIKNLKHLYLLGFRRDKGRDEPVFAKKYFFIRESHFTSKRWHLYRTWLERYSQRGNT